jgi:sugar transferase (PEP-CTERM/EpsH1 system associated)
MARILVLCSRTPYPLTGGAKLRLFNTAKILSKDHTVDLLIVDEAPIEQDRIDALQQEFNDVTLFSYPSYRFQLNTLPGVLSRRPLQTFYYSFEDVQRWTENHIDQYDLLYCNHVRTAEYARGFETPKVVDLVDAISRNYAEADKNASGLWRAIYPIESKRLLRYERQTVSAFDHSFIITDADKQYIEGNDGVLSSLSVVPNGVRPEILDRQSFDPAECKRQLVFLGKMDYSPNVDAATHFAEDIFPLVRQRYPEVEFVVVGIDPTKEVRQLADRPNIHVTGFVDDPIEYLNRARIVVAPMRTGAGLQNKVLESMGLGKPVVTTTLGAEGIDANDGEHLLTADTPATFSEAITSLLEDEDECERIGTQARQLVEREYSWPSIESQLLDPIEAILDREIVK